MSHSKSVKVSVRIDCTLNWDEDDFTRKPTPLQVKRSFAKDLKHLINVYGAYYPSEIKTRLLGERKLK